MVYKIVSLFCKQLAGTEKQHRGTKIPNVYCTQDINHTDINHTITGIVTYTLGILKNVYHLFASRMREVF